MTTPGLPPRPPSGSGLRPIEGRDLTGFGPDGYQLGIDDYDFDLEGYERTQGDRFRAWVGRGLIRLGWLGLAAGIALGSAGIVAATQP
ncbi:MAG TPA: hypothetical protein VF371_12195, partial [Candidatus Limnocylindrales bacterium]